MMLKPMLSLAILKSVLRTLSAAGRAWTLALFRKEEEERERDDALRPEDPQAKKLELKQEAVLQKLEETHKEQKELLQAQKALLDEMKQQRSEQAAAGGQQQAQPAQQAAHDRIRRDADVSAIKDEMLVGLPENWAAMEAVGVGASSHKRR
ncbi:hypothetical protein FJT64_012296 [Amphibalanus amphitrite]|uniref:Uncharacterized protein n=1 Tax=Amphibalanus amphitrite TaxID=1232801 RepID=A0A6A4VD60_AMPAM|nr:hypothetical protein FJT64_012296 [Amphibalanus amphitrite]